MTLSNLPRWKKIVGPEYDVMVKRFLALFNDLKKDAEASCIVIPDNLQEKLLNAKEKQPLIPEDGVRNLMGNDKVMAELPDTAELIRILHDFENRRKYESEKLRQDLISLAEKLPKASRTFFIKELTPPAKKIKRPSRKMDKKQSAKATNKETRRAFALLGALMYQYMFQGLPSHEKDIACVFRANPTSHSDLKPTIFGRAPERWSGCRNPV